MKKASHINNREKALWPFPYYLFSCPSEGSVCMNGPRKGAFFDPANAQNNTFENASSIVAADNPSVALTGN